jgi:heptosyltransferase I
VIATRLDRVGIVMMSAVGDAVHVLPVINAIKRHQSASRITWVLQPGPASLVRGHPQVDEIIEFNRAKGFRAFSMRRASPRGRSTSLNLQVYFKAGVVTSFTDAPVKLGFDRERARDANWMFTTHRVRRIPASTCRTILSSSRR